MYLKPDIALNYTTRIWNIYTAGDKLLLLELRNEDTLSVHYDLYNIFNQQYLWQKLTLTDSWRTGISLVSEKIVVFHRFKSGTIPEVEGIIAFDTTTGNLLWEIHDVQPLAFGESSIKVLKGGDHVYISMTDGHPIKNANFINSTIDILKQPKIPLTYSEGSENFNMVRDFVKQKFQEQPVREAHYLEYNMNIFLAYHVTTDEGLAVKLVAFSNEGNIWFNQKVEINDKIVSDIFFIWSGYLFFIEGQHTLNAIHIKEE